MKRDFGRRDFARLGVVAACVSALPTKIAFAQEDAAETGLYRTSTSEDVMAAAKVIASLDVHGVLASVDEGGMPRVRSMSVSVLDDSRSVWMSTRPGSRKLSQLKNNPKASLHFADTEQWGYATFMGSVAIHEDEATIRQRSFFPAEMLSSLFPQFPADMVMLEFTLEWLEVAGRGVRVHPETWQPQGVSLR